MALIVKVESLRENNSGKGTALAFARVNINDVIQLDGLRIVKGKTGPFVSAPQQQSKKNKKWYDSPYHIVSQPVREAVQKAILDAFAAVKGAQTQPPAGDTAEATL